MAGRDCQDAGAPSEALQFFITLLRAGEAEKAWGCLSSEFQASLAASADEFAAGPYHEFEEGFGSWETYTVLPEMPVAADRVVVAITGDRTAEGMLQENDVSAVVMVRENGGWRLGYQELFLQGVEPPPFGPPVAAGQTTVEVDILGLVEGGASAEARAWLWARQSSSVEVDNVVEGRGSFTVLFEPGMHVVVVYAEEEGRFGATGWAIVVS